MKAAFVAALSVLLLVTALSTGWDLMYRVFYTLVSLLVISFLWGWINVRRLWFKHEIRTTRAHVGGRIEEKLTLENTSWVPKLWLELHDGSTLPNRRGNRVVDLGGYGRRTLPLVTPCQVRGEYTLGPIQVTSGDPFGLFKMRRRLPIGGTVIVYPAITPLASFGRLPGELPGGSLQAQRTHFTTPNAAGVREYQPGDALCRIHWLSSARQRRLMVKEFDLDPLSEVWLVLDLDSEVQAGSGQDSTEEWVVSVGATLANYFLAQQREVGIMTQGRVLVADRGYRQLQKVLELLAVVRSNSSTPLERLVISEEVRLSRGATVVMVTPSTDERWLAACRMLGARGVSVLAVLLEASTFGARQSSLLLVSSLAACGVPTYLVKKGDNLARALAQPAETNGVGNSL
ncbi:MAG: DUF58 domain-containing protein [Chloroflexota bacterium]